MNLRPYQETVIADFNREVATGKKRIMLVAPTGSGKTVIGSAIIKSIIERRRGVLLVAHRREIGIRVGDRTRAHGAVEVVEGVRVDSLLCHDSPLRN